MTVFARAALLSIFALLVVSFTPPSTHAFQIFGLRFFENEPTPTPSVSPTPTATPTPTPTPTPTAAATPAPNAAGQVMGDSNLPGTGPETNIMVIAGVMVAATVARKYWQVSHQL